MLPIILLCVAAALTIISEFEILNEWKEKYRWFRYSVVALVIISLGLSIYAELDKQEVDGNEKTKQLTNYQTTIGKLDSIITTGKKLNDSLSKEISLQKINNVYSTSLLTHSENIRGMLAADSESLHSKYENDLWVASYQLMAMSYTDELNADPRSIDSVKLREKLIELIQKSYSILAAECQNPILKKNTIAHDFWLMETQVMNHFRTSKIGGGTSTNVKTQKFLSYLLKMFRNYLGEYFLINQGSYKLNKTYNGILEAIRYATYEVHSCRFTFRE